jgi:nitrate reductase gamma subunit
VVAVGFALVLLLAGFVVSLAVPEWLGLAAAIAPAVAGAGGLLLGALGPTAVAAAAFLVL